MPPRATLPLLLGLMMIAPARADNPPPIPVDRSGYRDDCGVSVREDAGSARTIITWPIEGGEVGRLAIDRRAGEPLFEELGIGRDGSGEVTVVARRVRPMVVVTVGTRVATGGRPPGMSPHNEFFDSPAKRPHRAFSAVLKPTRARVTSRPGRASIAFDGLEAGPFAGELVLTVYAGARLLHVEAVVATDRTDCAYFYDAGLVGESPGWRSVAWTDTQGHLRREPFDPKAKGGPVAVRHRAIVAESDGASLAAFPPPHQYFFPRDYTDNLMHAWRGLLHGELVGSPGIGIRQAEEGGGRFSPWISAPPRSPQRLGIFTLLAKGGAEDASREALRYTHGDRYPDIPGHVTFTSHWHMATAVAAMKEIAAGTGRTVPDFVAMFKDMNVRAVHLAEFHGDGHPQDPGPLRLPELEAMFAECRRLSDDRLVFLPGEEANVYLNATAEGSQPGHWIYLFPKPVRWVMKRARGEPFAEERPDGGTLYRVGDRADMLRLLEAERGLAWTAHARIKSSSWAPDGYRNEPFFKSPTWLGAAWKAMPADNASPKLGNRVLDLLDDMSNWGGRKVVLGEVDVFKLDRTHELYGHMNINYVKLDRVPRFEDDWSPLLDALRAGRFTVTTGEVLIRDHSIGGDPDRPEVKVDLDWTFPLAFAEVISGDGKSVFRDRVDLSDTGAFGRKTLTLRPDLRGRTWARFEAWDVAANGAFTQPTWLAPR